MLRRMKSQSTRRQRPLATLLGSGLAVFFFFGLVGCHARRAAVPAAVDAGAAGASDGGPVLVSDAGSPKIDGGSLASAAKHDAGPLAPQVSIDDARFGGQRLGWWQDTLRRVKASGGTEQYSLLLARAHINGLEVQQGDPLVVVVAQKGNRR